MLFACTKLTVTPWTSIPTKVWVGIAYLAVFTTIVTFFISQWATLHLGPTRVMAYSYLYPPLIVLIEWLLYHDLPSPRTMLGILVILPAMLIVQKGQGNVRKSKQNM
jgi:drug/metabolite transporter (DMT)-like permease